MRIAVLSGAGGTLGDDMVYCVIQDWLRDFGCETVLNPSDFSGVSGVILGGCGIIYDEGVVINVKGNSERYHRYIMEAKKKNIPCIGFGLGWQGLPLTVGKDIWVETLDALDFLTVWNRQTKDYLLEMGVVANIIASVDLGFVLQPKGEPLECDVALLSHSPRVMTIDCHKPEWKESLFEKLKTVMVSLPGEKIIYPFSGETEQLSEIALACHGTLMQGEPHRIIGAVRGAKICITDTLHALITAATAGCRILALYPAEPLKPKIRWMAEELNVRRLPFTATAEQIIDAVSYARHDNPPDISRQVHRNMANKCILQSWIDSLR